jgi:hypothetical protein
MRHTSSATPWSRERPAATILEIAGFRVSGSDEENLGEEELGNLGFNPGGGTPLYRPQRAASSSRTSKWQRWIGCLVALHRAASCSRKKTMKRYLGWAQVGQTVGLRRLGCDLVSASSIFFCSVSFLLFPVFCFAISNTSFNFVFADFEFRSVLKYTNDIIGPNMCYYIYHVCALAHKMLKDHWDLSRF